MKNLKSTLFHRLLPLYALVICWTLTLLGRLVYLQVFQAERLRLQGEQQQVGFIELSPQRGDILDRQLEELAISVQADSVFSHPREVSDAFQVAHVLAPILQANREEIYKKLTSDRPFVYLARKIGPRQVEEIRKLRLEGVYFQKESKRVYPNRELAAHVLGFVGTDGEGLSGLEYLFNHLIKGQRTRLHVRMDALRQSFERQSDPAQTDGHLMVLTIDKSLQYLVEQVLQATVEATRAVNGSAIVMDPHSGEILAMASYPTFNPNRYADYDEETRRNRAILEIYEPGSTFKIITAAAVLNEGLANPSESIDCRVGTLRIAGKVYQEAKHSYGVLTFNQIVAKSSNVGVIKLGLRLGEERLFQYIRRFGFGQKTGVELPGEQVGLLRPPSEWSKISIGAISIGQEIGVTPLQMIRAISVLANGGHLVTPRLVRQILTPQGDVIDRPREGKAPILEPATIAKMKTALGLVVDEGTGKHARLSGYSSAGKTGTAQKFIDGRYSDTKFIASYAGFAPLDNPALAAVVVINEPAGEHYGALVAAPAFKQIMERCLIHLRVPQDRPSLPLELARSRDISISEEEMTPEKLEETVETLMEQKPVFRESEHIVTLEVGSFPVPDFSGLSLREVARECIRLGLRLKVSGSGVAVGQRPRAGTQVFEDAVCEVFFSPTGNVYRSKDHATKQIALQGGRPTDSPR